MSNGDEYVLDELDKAINHLESVEPDYPKCELGVDFAKGVHLGTTVLLKVARIDQRDKVHSKKKTFMIGGMQVTGWSGLAGAILWLFAKTHGWME